MGLEVYYPNDIRNAIRAAEQATVTALGDGGGRYLEGYRAALITIALAFGLTGGDNGRQLETDTWRPVALGR